MAADASKLLVLLDEGVIKAFIGDDPQAHHRAEQEIKARLANRVENPTIEEQFEATKRAIGDGLLVRTEDLKEGWVDMGFVPPDGDYLVLLGPQYEVAHRNIYPTKGTTQLTIKKRKD